MVNKTKQVMNIGNQVAAPTNVNWNNAPTVTSFTHPLMAPPYRRDHNPGFYNPGIMWPMSQPVMPYPMAQMIQQMPPQIVPQYAPQMIPQQIPQLIPYPVPYDRGRGADIFYMPQQNNNYMPMIVNQQMQINQMRDFVQNQMYSPRAIYNIYELLLGYPPYRCGNVWSDDPYWD